MRRKQKEQQPAQGTEEPRARANSGGKEQLLRDSLREAQDQGQMLLDAVRLMSERGMISSTPEEAEQLLEQNRQEPGE